MRFVFGSMTFGPQVDEQGAMDMLESFYSAALGAGEARVEIDTAFMYNGGDSEKMIGTWLKSLDVDRRAKVHLATKVNPWETGRLQLSDVQTQLNESLSRLSVDSVDLLYLHGPSHETPIEETLEALLAVHKEGKFRELGLSNFSAWQLVDIVRLCELKSYPFRPAVYQGMLNGLTRSVEEIFEPCRKFSIRFYAYNPLAGGLLSGRYTSFGEQPAEGRFVVRAHYKNRFWLPEYFAAMKQVQDAIQQSGELGSAPLAEVALRWLAHHSKLNAAHGDAVIIGASSLKHLAANMSALNSQNSKPLPESVVAAFDDAWKRHIAGVCPAYGR